VSNKYRGFVAKLGTKTGEGKRGPWTLYSVKIEKEDGSEYPDWVSLGFDEPSCKEGDFVVLEASDDNGRQKLVPGTLKRVKNGPARKQKAAAPASGGAKKWGGGGGGGYKADPDKDRRITFMNCRTAAVEFIALLEKLDALPISAAATKAGKAKREEEIVAILDKYTVRFFGDTVSVPLRVLENVQDIGIVEQKKPDGKLPDEDEGDDEDADAEDETDDEEEYEDG
jgi:hypothetical protein